MRTGILGPIQLKVIFASTLKQGLCSYNAGVDRIHMEASRGGSQMRTSILGAIRFKVNFCLGFETGAAQLQ
jgi:hypothetical protein